MLSWVLLSVAEIIPLQAFSVNTSWGIYQGHSIVGFFRRFREDIASGSSLLLQEGYLKQEIKIIGELNAFGAFIQVIQFLKITGFHGFFNDPSAVRNADRMNQRYEYRVAFTGASTPQNRTYRTWEISN